MHAMNLGTILRKGRKGSWRNGRSSLQSIDEEPSSFLPFLLFEPHF